MTSRKQYDIACRQVHANQLITRAIHLPAHRVVGTAGKDHMLRVRASDQQLVYDDIPGAGGAVTLDDGMDPIEIGIVGAPAQAGPSGESRRDIAIGGGSNASNLSNATGNIAIGYQATSQNSTNGVAIGNQAVADTYTGVVAIGDSADANNGDDGTAVGRSSTAGTTASAIGSTSTATGAGSTAVGYGTSSTQNYTVAVGQYAIASATNAVAIGGSATSGVGVRATAGATNAIAVGAMALANGAGSIGIGMSCNAAGDNAIAIGSLDGSDTTTATQTDAIAIGNDCGADHEAAVCLGRNLQSRVASETIINGVTWASQTVYLAAGGTWDFDYPINADDVLIANVYLTARDDVEDDTSANYHIYSWRDWAVYRDGTGAAGELAAPTPALTLRLGKFDTDPIAVSADVALQNVLRIRVDGGLDNPKYFRCTFEIHGRKGDSDLNI